MPWSPPLLSRAWSIRTAAGSEASAAPPSSSTSHQVPVVLSASTSTGGPEAWPARISGPICLKTKLLMVSGTWWRARSTTSATRPSPFPGWSQALARSTHASASCPGRSSSRGPSPTPRTASGSRRSWPTSGFVPASSAGSPPATD